MNIPMLKYLNKLNRTHTIQQIASMCGYKYHTIFYIFKTQELSDRQTDKCYSNLYDYFEGELKEIELIAKK